MKAGADSTARPHLHTQFHLWLTPHSEPRASIVYGYVRIGSRLMLVPWCPTAGFDQTNGHFDARSRAKISSKSLTDLSTAVLASL